MSKFSDWLLTIPVPIDDAQRRFAKDFRDDPCMPEDATDLGCILLHIVDSHRPVEAAIRAACELEQEWRLQNPHTPPPNPGDCTATEEDGQMDWLLASFVWTDWQREHSHAYIDSEGQYGPQCDDCTLPAENPIHNEPFQECRHV